MKQEKKGPKWNLATCSPSNWKKLKNICFYYKLKRYFLENKGKVKKQTLATIRGWEN